MTSRSHRILYTIAALVLGIGVVLLITFAGKRSQGPLENFFNNASSAVNKVEEDIILQNREGKHSDKLKWFESYRLHLPFLLHPRVILLGAFDNQTDESLESIISLEDSLRTTFPLVHIYTAWGSKPEEQFPKLKVEAILQLGSIPVITWEPWLTDFDATTNPQLRKTENRDKGGMADVAKGRYDFYLKEWALQARAVGKPIFLRLGHEMNDPYRYPWGPQNNRASDFIAAWRHVHKLFDALGVKNILWVWSPHPAYGYFDAFYPGIAYVDYVGVGTLNYGTVANWSQWWSFKDIFGKHYQELAGFNKPIMLTEFGCLAIGGSRPDWFSEALAQIPADYPLVKSILFFHFSDDRTTTQQSLNWYFKTDSLVTKAIISQLKSWPDSVKAGR
jgi:hypothetical protein